MHLQTTCILQLLLLAPLGLATPMPAIPLPPISIAIGKDFATNHPQSQPGSQGHIQTREIHSLAQALTCVQLDQVNARIDEFVHHVYPAGIQGDKLTAENGLAGAYKGLVNALHRGDCIPPANTRNEAMKVNTTGNTMDMDMDMNRLVSRQSNPNPVINVICIVIDRLLGGDDAGATPSPPGGGSSSSVTLQTGSAMVTRQDDTNGIVKRIIAIVGMVLQTVLGCGEENEDDGSGSSASAALMKTVGN